MNPRLTRKIGLIAAVFLIAGLIRIPWQGSLLERMRETGFHNEPEGVSVISQLGVESAVGALGGLRYLVAFYFELATVDPWDAKKWDEVDENYRIICLLQPSDVDSWRRGGWHCAYNARGYYVHDAQHLEDSVRIAAVDFYTERGIWFLEQGIKWNPDDPWLWRDLGFLYQEKVVDPCKAAAAFLEGSKLPKSPAFMRRFYGYQLALCPGHEQEAYDHLKEIYDFGYQQLLAAKQQGAPQQRINDFIKGYWKPTLITTIKELELKLNIPIENRIRETWDDQRLRINSPFRVEIDSNDADQ